MPNQFKPMLAVQYDEALVERHFQGGGHLLMSPKLDGIRALTMEDGIVGRSLKLIPNRYVQSELAGLQYLDGELVVGSVTAPDVYRATNSGVMSRNGEPDFTYWVFDSVQTPSAAFEARMANVEESGRVKVLPQTKVYSLSQIEELETKYLTAGFEGGMLRHPIMPYKFGRSTARQMNLLKVKREHDSEAAVTGVYEAMENQNEAVVNELGYIERSSHQENKVGKGMAGGFHAKDLYSGVEFDCGMGNFTHAERRWVWENRHLCADWVIVYRSFGYGVKDKPRMPRAKGFRNAIDMS